MDVSWTLKFIAQPQQSASAGHHSNQLDWLDWFREVHLILRFDGLNPILNATVRSQRDSRNA